MSGRESPTPAGPDLLARYLNAYMNARQMNDADRPWGLGDDALDALWGRLMEALAGDPQKLDRLIAELDDIEREKICETLVPLIFALPLRCYPAELKAVKANHRLVFNLRHLDIGMKCEPEPGSSKKTADKDAIEHVGYLPAALTAPFVRYLRRVLRCGEEKHRCIVTISSGGRRRRVRVTLLANERGVVIRFLERIPSPCDGGVK